jgi:hypothetical protein
MTQEWWDKMYNGQNFPLAPKETRYPNTFPGVSIFDPDSDGDLILDGADDQDHDGLSNAFEVARPANWHVTYTTFNWTDTYPYGDASVNPWSRVQPYNPCKPIYSHTCHLHTPFGYYDAAEQWGGQDLDEVGDQPTAPWTWPGSHPTQSLPVLP